MGGLKSKLRRPKSSSRKEKEASPGKKKSKNKKANLPDSQSARRTVDSRLPFSNYRQIFSIRNAWKAVSRSMEDCAKETLIRLLHEHPEHKVRFEDIKDITEEEDMRTSELFENIAMDIYQVYDDVINNLENVDAALRDIRIASQSFPLNKQMIKDTQSPFIDTIKITLGSERFTEATEENYILLYKFVEQEMGKHLVEVEVNPDTSGEPAIKVEINSEKKEEEPNVEPEHSDCLANTDVEKETEINTVMDGELCSKSGS